MKKKLIYRKLEYKNEIYYQLYRIVDNDEEIDIKNDKPGKDVEEFYYSDIPIENEMELKDILYTYYGVEDGDIYILNDPFLITQLCEEFYNKFKDFAIVPKNDFDVNKINDDFSNKIFYQDEPANEVLNIIKSNLDILDLDISIEKKRKLKHNILLYGPKGFGKKTLVESILENTNVPCTVLTLDSNPGTNLNLVITGLGTSAFGNMKKAENGIVLIKDNFDELSERLEDGIEPTDLLESLLGTQTTVIDSNSTLKFDLTKITYILVKDTLSNVTVQSKN